MTTHHDSCGETSTDGQIHGYALLAALVIVSVLLAGVAFSGSVAAAENTTIEADPEDPEANATHNVTAGVTSNEGGNSLSSVYVYYSVGEDFNGSVANVTKEDVLVAGVDMDGHGDIDQQAKSFQGVEHPSNGTLVFDFAGDTDIQAGDRVKIVYNNTTNPLADGNYTVAIDINYQSTPDPVNATLRIGENVTQGDDTTKSTAIDPASEHDEIIDSAPPRPGLTTTHHVAIATSSNEVGNSLNDIRVNYHADGSFDGSVQDVGIGDVKKVGFDVDGDGDIETSTMNDLKEVSTSNVGETVTFDFGGNYGIKDDYTVIVVYSDAVNPSSPIAPLAPTAATCSPMVTPWRSSPRPVSMGSQPKRSVRR